MTLQKSTFCKGLTTNLNILPIIVKIVAHTGSGTEFLLGGLKVFVFNSISEKRKRESEESRMFKKVLPLLN